MTCAEAIAVALGRTGRPMRAAEVADVVNRLSLYQRTDGRPLPAYQVSSVAHANPGSFRVTGGLIQLAHPGRTPDGAGLTTRPVAPAAVLVGCVSRKQPTARPARELYRTELFARRRAYAEASGLPWLIVSAHYGIVDPDSVIEPYDVRIGDLDWQQRRALSERVADQLAGRFGDLAEAVLEVHAGDEYVQMLSAGLRPRGARLVNPLRGLRIGEQLAWYAARTGGGRKGRGLAPDLPDRRASALRHPGLALQVTTAFRSGQLHVGDGAPPPGWAGMPEVALAQRMRHGGASDRQVRQLITFTAALDRARNADALWSASGRMFRDQPWAFDPDAVVSASLTELTDTLRTFGVSQRHGPDAAAWRVIAESLRDPAAAPGVRRAVVDGDGDAAQLLEALQLRSPGGSDRFPFLRGPKVGPMWVRMLAHPGGARITSLQVLPVAVDVQVRKVSEYLGVVDTGPLPLDEARPLVQQAWGRDVADNGAVGPPPLAGTAAALDPALWFWGKWGCTRCEATRRRQPIGSACTCCRFPGRG